MPDTGRRVSILLVDDSPTDAELCMDTLRKHKLANQLIWVKDGEEALEYLFAEGRYADRKDTLPPQLVLLDLAMPKVNGFEVLRRIRAESATRTIPVVVMTSSQEERDITESYNLGVNSYVSKPVVFDEFASTVAHLGLYWLVVNRLAATAAPV
jgi:two-component system response regulator